MLHPAKVTALELPQPQKLFAPHTRQQPHLRFFSAPVMGRKPNQLILEFFERGPKLEDASNRYQHTCKSCGEKVLYPTTFAGTCSIPWQNEG